MCAYPVGIPLLTLLILARNSQGIRDGGPARARYAFLVDCYRPEYYFFDCLEMLRKVTITGLMIFINRGSVFQLLVTMLFCLGFGFTFAWCQPYESRAANLFKVATEAALLVTLVISALLRIDLSDEVLPSILVDPGHGLDTEVVGVLLVLVNTAIPAAGLAVGLASFSLGVSDLADLADLAAGEPDAPVDELPRRNKLGGLVFRMSRILPAELAGAEYAAEEPKCEEDGQVPPSVSGPGLNEAAPSDDAASPAARRRAEIEHPPGDQLFQAGGRASHETSDGDARQAAQAEEEPARTIDDPARCGEVLNPLRGGRAGGRGSTAARTGP